MRNWKLSLMIQRASIGSLMPRKDHQRQWITRKRQESRGNSMWTKHGTEFISCSRALNGKVMVRSPLCSREDARFRKTWVTARPHGFTSSEVKEIDAALRALDPTALYEQADPG